ncbi:hypothetical protein AJ80_00588 [Polytolypa hystricis UAMH7299]|uniref:Cyanovirin-N domain-containing protein n=1 Tax=Polytolypa hystricis (strain UAMH7299) TaxID=1447883 RepID=A0A2B7Z321_POLH7|nr:hypothetical protein AJ80_00588 [Polytolypa hystricis UAMH7299]
MSPFKKASAALLVLALGIPNALAGFADDCESFSLQGRNLWLVAECLDGAGGIVKSTAFLGNWITNNNGELEWKEDGAFQNSCQECSISGTQYTCTCATIRETKSTTIDLNEHFVNKNGVLQSNLSGEPQDPGRSDMSVPESFEYAFSVMGGNDGCDGAPFTLDELLMPLAYSFTTSTAARFELNPGWELTAYSERGCSGDILGVIGPADGNNCLAFSALARSVCAEPLWTSI